MTVNPARIGILEDDNILRPYLAKVIEAEPSFQLVFACETVESAKSAARSDRVDACLVDLELSDGTGFEFTRFLKSHSNANVLILSVLGDRKSVLMALQSGADGYLLKDAAPEQIINDLKCVLSGDTPISPQAATHLLRSFTSPKTAWISESDPLTERELETLRFFERGLSYRETADALGVSHNTVRTHVKSIYSKLSVNSRNEAIFEARQHGWLDD